MISAFNAIPLMATWEDFHYMILRSDSAPDTVRGAVWVGCIDECFPHLSGFGAWLMATPAISDAGMAGVSVTVWIDAPAVVLARVLVASPAEFREACHMLAECYCSWDLDYDSIVEELLQGSAASIAANVLKRYPDYLQALAL